ncbi:Oidioi.mRNA.OKI2018_I69.PAR.g9297.t1.cds [Oikopleura dioica]|uniref:Oidioi.mRNA.OKI2018_I69.PAR.g9297.t1.cds n=1 Tax=Oikopleura dioica TaxID=34765 RepID=A0ABN7RQV9_OIKDI|nr:Oidioi.mRNA.OKI2018_I69.PAR.g9297.t1.cds [Oikopleura dioica]
MSLFEFPSAGRSDSIFDKNALKSFHRKRLTRHHGSSGASSKINKKSQRANSILTLHGRTVTLKFDYFIEILNAVNFELTGENVLKLSRREWMLQENRQSKIAMVEKELVLWGVLTLNENFIEKIIDAQESKLQWLVFVAMSARKAAPFCRRFRLNGQKRLYYELSEKYEQLACSLLNDVSRDSPLLGVILVRRRQAALGFRNVLDTGHFGDLAALMATNPVQEVITKIWYGALDPETPMGPMICSIMSPLFSPLLIHQSTDPLIDYNTRVFNCTETNLVDTDENGMDVELSYFEKVFVFFTAPYTAWFYSLLFHISFLIYYAYVIIQKFCYAPTIHEIIVVIVLIGVCVEQIRRHMSGNTKKGIDKIFDNSYNILYLMSFVLASIAGILRFGIWLAIPQETYDSLGPSYSWGEACPPRIIGAQALKNVRTEDIIGGEGVDIDIYLKWAQVLYGSSFALIGLNMAQFMRIHPNLGPLAISLGYMLKDFYKFCYLLLVIVLPYGVIFQFFLYPNDPRLTLQYPGHVFAKLSFKPFYAIFGETFKSETSTYAYENVPSCAASQIMIPTPNSTLVHNAGNIEILHLQGEEDVPEFEPTSLFYNIPYFKPHHLYEENKTEVSINGLIRLGDFKEAVAENRMNYTEDDLLYHGVPNFLAPGSNFTDDQLFIPRQESVFNPVFPRCPERHWFNSILLMCYMMLVAVLLINLLVAMFATTYNKIHESSEQIWRRQRYELLLDYYNNPGRPVTPPFSLLLSFYWLIKYIILRIKNVSPEMAKKNILYPRMFGQHFLRLPREEPTGPEMVLPKEFGQIFHMLDNVERKIIRGMHFRPVDITSESKTARSRVMELAEMANEIEKDLFRTTN